MEDTRQPVQSDLDISVPGRYNTGAHSAKFAGYGLSRDAQASGINTADIAESTVGGYIDNFPVAPNYRTQYSMNGMQPLDMEMLTHATSTEGRESKLPMGLSEQSGHCLPSTVNDGVPPHGDAQLPSQLDRPGNHDHLYGGHGGYANRGLDDDSYQSIKRSSTDCESPVNNYTGGGQLSLCSGTSDDGLFINDGSKLASRYLIPGGHDEFSRPMQAPLHTNLPAERAVSSSVYNRGCDDDRSEVSFRTSQERTYDSPSVRDISASQTKARTNALVIPNYASDDADEDDEDDEYEAAEEDDIDRQARARTHRQKAKMYKRKVKRTGAQDPENLFIVDAYENKNLDFHQIANLLNLQREARGEAGIFQANNCHNRYNRTAPFIFKANNKVFIPIKERAKNKERGKNKGKVKTQQARVTLDAISGALILGSSSAVNWTPHMDRMLRKMVLEFDSTKWTIIAGQLSSATGQAITAEAVAGRYSIIPM